MERETGPATTASRAPSSCSWSRGRDMLQVPAAPHPGVHPPPRHSPAPDRVHAGRCCVRAAAGQRTPLLGCTAAIRDPAAADSPAPSRHVPTLPRCRTLCCSSLCSERCWGWRGEPGARPAVECSAGCYNRWCGAGQSATVCGHQPAPPPAAWPGSVSLAGWVPVLAGGSIPVRHRLQPSPDPHSDHMQ